MTLVNLPCTARQLESALHAICDHDGLWGARVRIVPPRDGRNPYHYHMLAIETETQGEAK